MAAAAGQLFDRGTSGALAQQNFWILPVEVLGIASKRMSRGTL